MESVDVKELLECWTPEDFGLGELANPTTVMNGDKPLAVIIRHDQYREIMNRLGSVIDGATLTRHQLAYGITDWRPDNKPAGDTVK